MTELADLRITRSVVIEKRYKYKIKYLFIDLPVQEGRVSYTVNQ